MPAYNTPKNFFKPAIDSILNQKYKNLELIIVDDGSDKNSIHNTVKEYNDERLIYINQGHHGAGEARNIGIQHATGDWIYIMASDDVLDKNCFSVCMNLAKKYDSDIVLFNLVGQPDDKTIEFFNKPVPIFGITNPGDTTQICKRKLIIDNNIKYENFTSCNDLTFTYTILACAEKVVKINQAFYFYNTNVPTQISSNRGTKAKNVFYAFDALKCNLKNKNLFNTYQEQFYKCMLDCVAYELSLIYDNKYKHEFLSILKRKYSIVYKWLFPRKFKWFNKERFDNGTRIIYAFGIKILTYHKHKNFDADVHIFNLDIKKHLAYQKHQDEITQLILGASTGRDGYWPEKASECNLCSSSQGLYQSYNLYKFCSKHSKNLKNVILFFGVFTPGFQLEKTSEAYKSIIYKHLYNIPYAFRLKREYRKFERKVKKYVKNNNIIIDDNYYGQSSHDTFDDSVDVKELVSKHMKNNLRQNNAMSYLDKTIKLCQQNKHNFIIVIPPYRSDYLEHLGSEKVVFDRLYKTIDKYTDVKVLSFLRDKRFKEKDFGDSRHLNETGAKKLTKYINEVIKQGLN